MKPYQQKFIELSMSREVLCFGEYTLTSGRVSPYYFNTNLFYSGATLIQIGHCYAKAIVESDIQFDMIFGTAYKGISLGAATAFVLSEHFDQDIPYAYNRKESKDYGEGGLLVGSCLHGKVLIIDDVIVTGTTVCEIIALINKMKAEPSGVIVGLDREEKGVSGRSAVQEIKLEYNIPVLSIIVLQDIISYLENEEEYRDDLEKIRKYCSRYGV